MVAVPNRSLTIVLVVVYTAILVDGGSWATWRSVDTYLNSPQVTSWGNWGSWAFCYPGDYVVGVTLRVESPQGRDDDTGLNAIRLRCSSLNGKSTYNIQSKEGGWGDWGSYGSCQGLATGFELRSEPSQGGGDDVAASNFRLYCSGPDRVHYVGEANTREWGSWTGLQKCPAGQAICGIVTQVEDPVGRDDDTSLNNVNIACCNVEHPTASCTPYKTWKTLSSCSGEVCSVSYRAGIAYNSDRSGNVAPSTSFYEHFGLKLENAYGPLAKRFKERFPSAEVDKLINSDTAKNRFITASFLDCYKGIEVLEMTCGMYTLTSPVEHKCTS